MIIYYLSVLKIAKNASKSEIWLLWLVQIWSLFLYHCMFQTQFKKCWGFDISYSYVFILDNCSKVFMYLTVLNTNLLRISYIFNQLFFSWLTVLGKGQANILDKLNFIQRRKTGLFTASGQIDLDPFFGFNCFLNFHAIWLAFTCIYI